METLKVTPIDQIEDLADGVPVLAVEGTVKYAADITRGTTKQGKDWTKQFFVLGSETADIGCSMWDAEGNELTKGEKVHIENTQNKKGQWTGMVKGSYIKEGKDGEKLRNHTLEIRANQVKIRQPNGKEPSGDEHGIEEIEQSGGGATFHKVSGIPTDKGIGDMAKKAWAESQHDWTEAPENGTEVSPERSKLDTGVSEARKHLMQSANLYNLCVSAVDKAIAPNMPNIAQTSEQFQAAVASLFIEASREVWWSGKIVKPSLIESMPTKPLQ